MKDLVSVIIPTYNRYYYLINAIKSVKQQTYPNIQIIVVNDGSTQSEYYKKDKEIFLNVLVINIMEGSRKIFGYPSPGYVRNKGIKEAKGKYIAFLDDDDIWFPQKIEIQISEMKKRDYKMSCTEGLIGSGFYNKNKIYPKYNSEYYYNTLQQIFNNSGSSLINNGLPNIFDLDLITIHNCIITSSVIIDKELINKAGKFDCININEFEDYKLWLKILKLCDCLYIDKVLFYYDKDELRF